MHGASTGAVWDRLQKLRLVRVGDGDQRPPELTLRRLTRSVLARLWLGVPAHAPAQVAAQLYLLLMVRWAIVTGDNLTDQISGECVTLTNSNRVKGLEGETLVDEAYIDALSDLDLAMIVAVARDLVPPDKAAELAAEQLAIAKKQQDSAEGAAAALARVELALAKAGEELAGAELGKSGPRPHGSSTGEACTDAFSAPRTEVSISGPS